MQVLSHNLANVDTPGFKREMSIIQARHSEAIERGLETAGRRSLDDLGGGVGLEETATDFERGTLRHTAIQSDLAIENPDVFFVIDRNGQELLTRAGNFGFAADGTLQTPDGEAVMGIDGPIQINPVLPWSITDDGAVLQGATQTGIRLVKPQSKADLVKAGGNTFMPLAEVVPAVANERRVRSGFLEQSTVKPTSAMMELITTSRAYEANIRMIQHHDQISGALVNRILR
jgi:flagellar basal-body rod protein FlgF/flagellar basal-body rod protein FlgG